MKKIFSLVLVLVLIFSLAVPSFATELEPPAPDYNTELDALNAISGKLDTLNANVLDIYLRMIDTLGLYLRNIKEDISNSIVPNLASSLAQLLDINDFTRSSYDEIKKIRENLFGDTLYLQSFADGVSSLLSTISTNVNNLKVRDQFLWTSGTENIDWDNYKTSWYYMVYDDLNTLQEVLADEDDLALKESQKGNQEQAEQYFMTGNSSNSSIGGSDIGALSDFSNYFVSFFAGSSVNGSQSAFTNAMSYFNSYTQPDLSTLYDYPLLWFTEFVSVDINQAPSTFSYRDPNRVVTSFYSENASKVEDIFGGVN